MPCQGCGRRAIRKARRPRIISPAASQAAYSIAREHYPKFKEAYRITAEELKNPKIVSRLARAIESKSIAQIDAVIPVYRIGDPKAAEVWQSAADTFEERYRQLVDESGKSEFARLKIPIEFTLNNPYSIDYARRKAAGLIQNISSQTRQVIRRMIRDSFVEGLSADKLQRLIRSQLALPAPHAMAAQRRYAASLEDKVSPQRAGQMLDRYTAKLINARAETIARTEIISAEAQGQLDAWRVARREGLLVPGTRRKWIGEGPGVCEICEELHDSAPVDIDEPWDYEGIMAPPAHPRCRCVQVLLPPED
jgi:hypothetical protein